MTRGESGWLLLLSAGLPPAVLLPVSLAHNRIVVSTDGSVLSCRMPVSGSSGCISGPALQGRPLHSSQAAKLLPGLSWPGAGRLRRRPRAVSSRNRTTRQAVGGPGPRRLAGPGPVRAPMLCSASCHPAGTPTGDRLAGPGAAPPLRLRASRQPSSLDTIVTGPGGDPGTPSSIQPCENASRVPRATPPVAVGPTGGVRGRPIRRDPHHHTGGPPRRSTIAPDARRPPIRAAPARSTPVPQRPSRSSGLPVSLVQAARTRT